VNNFSMQVLQALSGDSIYISYHGYNGKNHSILIDGGMPNTFQKSIKNILSTIDSLEYIFLTHIDRDHIGGILKLLDSQYIDKIQNIYFNSGNIIGIKDSKLVSESAGISLIEHINKSSKIKTNKKEITIDTVFDLGGLRISFFSPTYDAIINFNKSFNLGKIKEEALISDSKTIDTKETICNLANIEFKEKKLIHDPANGVSLAMFLEYKSKRILLLGDAKDSIVINTLKEKKYSISNKLKVDYIKLSHHGSKYHTSKEFLDLIDCKHFIISANGTNKHPNIETLARILCHKERDKTQIIYFYFNYPRKQYEDKSLRLLTDNEEKKYNCKCIYDKTLFELEG